MKWIRFEKVLKNMADRKDIYLILGRQNGRTFSIDLVNKLMEAQKIMANKTCRYCEDQLVTKELNSIAYWFCPTCKWIFGTVVENPRCVHCGVSVDEGETVCDKCADMMRREWGI